MNDQPGLRAPARDLRGVGVSPGLATGPVAQLGAPPAEPARTPLDPGSDAEAEAARVRAAAEEVATGLESAAGTVEGQAHDLLETTAQMARDPSLVKTAARRVREDRLTAARAVWEAAGTVAEQLRGLGGYMAERANDVTDVRNRIVAVLTGTPLPGVPTRTEPFVLVAQDLAPADTALLDPARVRAIVTAEGGPTSHTAILARSLGIPAVVALEGAPEALPEGTVVLVDGGAGTVRRDPDPADVERASAVAGRERTFDGRGRTADGHEVALLANVGDARGAKAAAAAGAQGVGLFRTEFCFLDRGEEPSVEEQTKAYREVLAHFPGQKVVVRTLDAGADKPLPFLTDTAEANPALGVRGLRTARRAPDVLDHQLEAVAAAAAAESAEVWVMAPMVATVDRGRGLRGGVRRPRARPGRGHGRGPRRRPARRADPGPRSLRLDRDERPHPVRHGGRPAPRLPGRPLRLLAAGGPAAGGGDLPGRGAAVPARRACAARPPPTRRSPSSSWAWA